MNKKTIDIICPLYNAEKYILNLHNSFHKQKNVEIENIRYILTESSDNTEQLLIHNKIKYKKIKKEDFSHSLVREKEVYESDASIVVFVSQDVEIKRNDWLYNLIKDIDEEVVATYSRQISKTNNIEKYVREYNYPKESKIVTKENLRELGLKTFFFSDAASAIKKDVFVKLNGYDKKNLLISEDMYIAYKIIMAGYKIKYCAESEVYHSHNFTIKQLYQRYKLTGQFFKENNYLNQYNTIKTGVSLAKYILKRVIEEKNLKSFFRYPFDMAARFIGMKVGMK